MRLIHVMVSIPLALAALLALASLIVAAIWVKEGHAIMLCPEHMFGLGTLYLLFVAASAVAFFYRSTPKHIIRDELVPSCSSTQSAMSAQPQPPIHHLLDVPDLVWSVFEWLDPASRRAFFQAHRDVAQNGHVLAHAKLRIELRPHSLKEQWRYVLYLTRSQPPRCLIIAGTNKERLQDFLRCVPGSKHLRKDKQRVLEGTELQLQVHIRMENGGVQRLHNLMRSWCNEQPSVEDTRVQLVLDLCGRKFIAINACLEPPSCCTLKNGTLQLRGTSRVRVASDQVRIESTVIVGTGMQDVLVGVASGGSLVMEGCCVKGGSFAGGAVWVYGAGAGMCAQGCSTQSEGCGIMVFQGRAALDHVTASMCGWNGVWVDGEGSTLNAAHCHMDGNVGYNVYVCEGAHCCLHHCSSDGSREHGCVVLGPSSLEASDSTTSSNRRCGAVVWFGAIARLARVTANKNGEHGWQVLDEFSSLDASESDTCSNKHCGALCAHGSSAILSRVAAGVNGLHGLWVFGSSVKVSDSITSTNKRCGALCEQECSASLSRVTADENGVHGLCAIHQFSSLEASEISANSNRWAGAAVFDGASASLSACTVRYNGGVGFCAVGGSSMVLKSFRAGENSLGNSTTSTKGRIFIPNLI